MSSAFLTSSVHREWVEAGNGLGSGWSQWWWKWGQWVPGTASLMEWDVPFPEGMVVMVRGDRTGSRRFTAGWVPEADWSNTPCLGDRL